MNVATVNVATAALLVVELLVKGPAFFKAANELAQLITDKGGEDLTPDEVAPYLLKLGRALDELEEALKN